MEMVRHNTFGIGEVVEKEVINGIPYLKVRFQSGKEMRLGIPCSFETGVVEALGSLKDEVDRAIAEKSAKLSAMVASVAEHRTAQATGGSKKTPPKAKPSGPVAAAYEKYLIEAGYSVESNTGNPSTVYSYLNAVDSVRSEEGLSWDSLRATISTVVPKYDAGGAKEAAGAKSNHTVICALKRFEDFVNTP